MRLVEITLGIGPFTFAKERPGVISKTASWVCISHRKHGVYLYVGSSVWQLVKDMWRSWNSDRSLVG